MSQMRIVVNRRSTGVPGNFLALRIERDKRRLRPGQRVPDLQRRQTRAGLRMYGWLPPWRLLARGGGHECSSSGNKQRENERQPLWWFRQRGQREEKRLRRAKGHKGQRKQGRREKKEKERKKRGGGVEAGPTQTEDDSTRAGADWLNAGGRDVTWHVRLFTLSPINFQFRL